MDWTKTFKHGLLAIALSGALATPFSYGGTAAAEAATQENRTITVTGIGEIYGRPNQAKISAGIITEAESADAALKQNNESMKAVFAGLKALGIPEKDIQTSDFSIVPQYTAYKKDAPPPKILSYRATNTLRITVKNLSKLGLYIDKFVELGANKLNNIEFGFSNLAQMQAQAREAAAADAKAKAELYARSLAVTLGDVLLVNEAAEIVNPPYPVARTMETQAMDFVPVSPGEQKVTAQVTVTMAIK